VRNKRTYFVFAGFCWAVVLFVVTRTATKKGGGETGGGVTAALRTSGHDFGDVIFDGQPLRHVFRFKNNGECKVRILRSIRSSTCCTSFGELPDGVEAGEILEVPVELKTVGKSGNLRGDFVIGSDSPHMPTLAMELSANLLEQFEVLDIRSDLQIPMGRPQTREFAVILRTRPGEPVAWPMVSGLSARLKDKPFRTGQVTQDIIESRRELAIAFEADKAGRFSDAIRFRWPGGREKEYVVAWEVVSPLRAFPQTLILDPSAGQASYNVMISSDDVPYRILGVTGESVRSFRVVPGENRRTQLKLQLDPTNERRSSIRITTDHPKVVEVGLDVIVPRSRREGRQR